MDVAIPNYWENTSKFIEIIIDFFFVCEHVQEQASIFAHVHFVIQLFFSLPTAIHGSGLRYNLGR